MVTTRSMSGTTKKIDTKIAVNDKQKAAKRASNKAKSGTTKIVATEIAVNDKQKAAKRASNKAKSGTTKIVGWPLLADAYCLFMTDYEEKYSEKYPPCPTGAIMSIELIKAIMQEWRDMSARDKAPYFESAKEMRAKGHTLR